MSRLFYDWWGWVETCGTNLRHGAEQPMVRSIRSSVQGRFACGALGAWRHANPLVDVRRRQTLGGKHGKTHGCAALRHVQLERGVQRLAKAPWIDPARQHPQPHGDCAIGPSESVSVVSLQSAKHTLVKGIIALMDVLQECLVLEAPEDRKSSITLGVGPPQAEPRSAASRWTRPPAARIPGMP